METKSLGTCLRWQGVSEGLLEDGGYEVKVEVASCPWKRDAWAVEEEYSKNLRAGHKMLSFFLEESSAPPVEA